MTAAPHPLRVLLAWPEPAASDLWRGLQTLGTLVDVTRAPAAELADFLRVAGYYHVLYVTPDHWRGLSPRQRARLAGRVCLVVLGPGQALAGDAEGMPSCLYMPAGQTAAEGVALCRALHQALSEGWRMSEIVASSTGRLVLAGDEPAWPSSPDARHAGSAAQASSAPGRAVTVVDAQGGAVAIGPAAQAVNVAPGGSYIERQTVTAGSGIAIGSIVVKGDMVAGNKVVQHAEGDQININRGAPAAGKLAQSAGGDQVNVNRMDGAPAPDAADTCPKCGEPVEPEHRFCLQCGAELAGAQRDKTTQDSFRARLRQGLIDCFSEGELHTLCFDMGLDYETLPARGKADKAREIVAHYERINSIAGLVERCRRLRPNGPWDEKPGQ